VPDLSYANIGEIILGLKQQAEDRGMRFVWYSPVPYCLFNPAAHGLGGQSCSAADGLLSIAPDGQVLPCSSFEQGIGNLLHEDFEQVWNRRSARYWRDKQFVPPGCKDCELVSLCCGACPLYWDEQGSLADIAPHLAPTTAWEKLSWQARRRWVGRVKGVGIN
jgi:radical SAM protein with 4Fe4S-binding SPASM domain